MLAISQKGFMIQQKLGPIAQLIEKKRVVPFVFQHNTRGHRVKRQQPGVARPPTRDTPTSPSYCTSPALLLLLDQIRITDAPVQLSTISQRVT